MPTRSLNVVITGDSRGINKVLDQTEKRTHSWGRSLGKGFAVAGAAAAGGLALGLKKSADAAIEAENAQSKMVTQLKAAGISYKAHAKQIDEVIQKTSKLSGLDDEDLQDSFTNIVRVTGDVNKSLKLTGLAADFARAKHMDVAKAGELVGKVAGGNIGILSRYGITVHKGASASEALALLQRKFAGQAAAYGKTTAGALDRAGVASENLGEIVGAKLTPLLAKGATVLVDMVDKAGQLGGPIREATGTVANAYNAVRKAVDRFVREHKADIDTAIKAARNLGRAVQFVFEEVLLPVIRSVIRAIVPILEGLKDVMIAQVRFITDVLTGKWSKAWDALKDIVKGVFKTIKAIIEGAASVLWTAVKALGGVIIKGLVAGLKGLGTAIKNAVVSGVKSGVSAATGAVGDAISSLNPFGDGIGKLAHKIGDGAGKLLPGVGALGTMPAVGGFSGALHGANAAMGPFARIAGGFGLGITAGRTDHSKYTKSGNLSYHGSGEALDFSNGVQTPQEMAFARFMISHFGGRLAELIYTPLGFSIKDGRRVSPIDAADHYNHVHVAFDLGKPGIGIGDGIGRHPFSGDGIGQAVDAAYKAGFRGPSLVRMVAIAGRESRYDAQAQNLVYPDHSIGMWQINQLAHHGRYGSDAQLKNAYVNARAAWAISGHGHNFAPWSTNAGLSQSWISRASRAVNSYLRGGHTGGGGGGGGGGSPTGVTHTHSADVLPTKFGPGGPLGYEGQLAAADVREAKARAHDSVEGLVRALVSERKIKRRRLKRIRKLLRGRLTREHRTALMQEEATLIGEIGDLSGTVKEYRADMNVGGATTITQAETLDAGVDPNAGGSGGGGSGGSSDDGGVAAAIKELGAAIDRQREANNLLIRTQGPAIVNAVVAAVNGSIGGSVGLGFSGIRSPAGSTAGL